MDVRRRYGGLHKAVQIDVSRRRYGGFWIRNYDPLCCKPFHSHLTELPLNGDKILLIFLPWDFGTLGLHIVEHLFIHTSLIFLISTIFIANIPFSALLCSEATHMYMSCFRVCIHIAFTCQHVEFFLGYWFTLHWTCCEWSCFCRRMDISCSAIFTTREFCQQFTLPLISQWRWFFH